MLDEELVERVDAMKREVDALLALVVVLLVVVVLLSPSSVQKFLKFRDDFFWKIGRDPFFGR